MYSVYRKQKTELRGEQNLGAASTAGKKVSATDEFQMWLKHTVQNNVFFTENKRQNPKEGRA
jgi:hypothetical protein